MRDSLRQLNTDRIDLYQLRRPDFETPHEETLHTLDGLVQQGLVAVSDFHNTLGWTKTRI